MHAHDHKPQRAHLSASAIGGEHERNAEDTALREFPLDLAAVRERLGKSSGKEYWRSLPAIRTSRSCCTANSRATPLNGMKRWIAGSS